MKTYSVAFRRNKDGIWITNWNKYTSVEGIDWDQVRGYVMSKNSIDAYGYYYGHNSSQLTSAKCRTVLWRKESEQPRASTS